MKSKICGVIDKFTLSFITSHKYAPEFIGFICNYKKSRRFLDLEKLRQLLKIDKKNSKYVAVLVKPSKKELNELMKLPFDYFQIYDLECKEIENIKKKYKIKIITAITVNSKSDVFQYKDYENVTDIILFDSKGYEKSLAFEHNLIKNLKLKIPVMVAGNIGIDDDLDNLKEIADIIDISGGLETSGLKDTSKINIFLNKIKKINNED